MQDRYFSLGPLRARALVLGLVASWGSACGPAETPAPPPPPAPVLCNGSAANCQRRYDQVTFAATHNAFSYAAGGPVSYLFPNQDQPIADQLSRGIRGLGIRSIGFAEQARVAVVVDLEAADAERLPPPQALKTTVSGLEIPRIPVGRGYLALPLVLGFLTTV